MENRIAYGVDLGWVSQLESMGIVWVDEEGNKIDPLAAVKKLGADAVRLRVFVDPPKEAFWKKPDQTECMLGFCDAESVYTMCRRVRKQGMRLMLDFHYSSHFADPIYQDIPDSWRMEDENGLIRRVEAHTSEILTTLREEGITPEWVQVGNEINPGILLPVGSRKENPAGLVRMLNAGYDAVKRVFPDCLVVTHVAGVLVSDVSGFYDAFFAYGGRTDILGLSYYPYWYQRIPGRAVNEDALRVEKLGEEMRRLSDRFQKPVLLAEVGAPEREEEASYRFLLDTIRVLHSYGEETGIFYWEPEVCADLLPDHYPLGAAQFAGNEKTLRFTKALSAYRDSRKKE